MRLKILSVIVIHTNKIQIKFSILDSCDMQCNWDYNLESNNWQFSILVSYWLVAICSHGGREGRGRDGRGPRSTDVLYIFSCYGAVQRIALGPCPGGSTLVVDASLTRSVLSRARRKGRKQRKFSRKRGEKTGQEQINQLEVCFSFQA